MQKFVWTNPYLPQTLQIPVIIGYLNLGIAAVFGLALGQGLSPFNLIILASAALGGFGIANVRWWGYILSIIAAFFPFVFVLFFYVARGLPLTSYITGWITGGNLLTTVFRVAIIIALLHPLSRKYVKNNFEKTIP